MRFTGEPAYFKHITEAGRHLMEASGTPAKDYNWAIFHQPNMKFPQKAAGMLGFSKERAKEQDKVECQQWQTKRLSCPGHHRNISISQQTFTNDGIASSAATREKMIHIRSIIVLRSIKGLNVTQDR